MPGAIHARRVPEIVGDGNEELAQQEDAEGIGHERHGQGRQLVQPRTARQWQDIAADHQKVGDHRDRFGDHHGRQQQAEDHIAAEEMDAPEGISRPGLK